MEHICALSENTAQLKGDGSSRWVTLEHLQTDRTTHGRCTHGTPKRGLMLNACVPQHTTGCLLLECTPLAANLLGLTLCCVSTNKQGIEATARATDQEVHPRYDSQNACRLCRLDSET